MRKSAMIGALVAGLLGSGQIGIVPPTHDKTIVVRSETRIENKRRVKRGNSHGLSPVGGCDKKSIAARRRRQGYDAYSQGEFIRAAEDKRMFRAMFRRICWTRSLLGQYPNWMWSNNMLFSR